MRAASKPGNRRRVTRNCQGQQAITTDLTPTVSIPATEPVKKKTPSKKTHRSERADDWAYTTVGDPRPCVLCGFPASMRDPYTNQPCHMTCAKQQATERGEQW